MRNARVLFACAAIAATRAEPASAADPERGFWRSLSGASGAIFFFLLNEPSLNGDEKLFFFLGVDASTAVAVVVVVVAVLSRRRRSLPQKKQNGCFFFCPGFLRAARASQLAV